MIRGATDTRGFAAPTSGRPPQRCRGGPFASRYMPPHAIIYLHVHPIFLSLNIQNKHVEISYDLRRSKCNPWGDSWKVDVHDLVLRFDDLQAALPCVPLRSPLAC